MAETKQGINIPQQSVVYIGVCLVGILIFVFGGILPAERSLKELETRIDDARSQLEGQKTLLPLLQSLQGQSEKKESQLLPLPEKGKLSRARIDTLPATFSTAAKASGMTLVSALPNLNALTGGAPFLQVDAVLRGDFIHFRMFLVQIGALPYIHHIEEITIQGKEDMEEFRVKVWVAVG